MPVIMVAVSIDVVTMATVVMSVVTATIPSEMKRFGVIRSQPVQSIDRLR